MKIAIIIVTYNSQKFIKNAINSILDQSYQNIVINIVDNNSDDPSYLRRYNDEGDIIIDYLDSNSGYCGGNNYGIHKNIDYVDYILIMNPDIIIPRDYIKSFVNYYKKHLNNKVGMIGTKLIRKINSTSNIIDSCGIYQKWYGKWYDRGQNESDLGQYDSKMHVDVPAICGALLFLNPKALRELYKKYGYYFNNSFFMYKEDIDMSLSLKNIGYEIIFLSSLIAFHKRGWKKRSSMEKELKVLSARNEVAINKNIDFIKLSYSLIKLLIAKIGC